MNKILVVFGTRPEAIKLAPVVKALENSRRHFSPIVCVTSQHREMLSQVLNIFDISPHYDLDIMKPRQSVTEVTVRVLEKLGEVISVEHPDLILVQGDTTTTFAAGLAAFYHKVKVGHVEAGLRTLDKYQPFPEEINRRLTTTLTDYHFAPTSHSRQNLLREGIADSTIIVTGNTGIDALFMALERLRSTGRIETPCFGNAGESNGRRLLLVTAHRRENFGPPFEAMCQALLQIARCNPDVMILYPVHMNPQVQSPVRKFLDHRDQIQLTEPLDYISFVQAMNRAYLILTDSGGIQEEAPALGKPVLVMRNTTERLEAVEAGTAKVVGTDAESIVTAVQALLNDSDAYARMSTVHHPFGDGHASERIVRHLLQVLGNE